MTGKVEVANDFWPQQRNYIRTDGKLKSGEDLFRDGRSTQNVAAFKHQNFFPGTRQVSGVHQAVVTAADYNHIVF